MFVTVFIKHNNVALKFAEKIRSRIQQESMRNCKITENLEQVDMEIENAEIQPKYKTVKN